MLRRALGISVLTKYSKVVTSWSQPASKDQTLQLSLSLRRLQLVLAHDPLMWFLTAFYPVLEAAIALRQLLGDDVFTSRNIPISGALKEDGLADLEFVIRHQRAPNAQDACSLGDDLSRKESYPQ
jgi:hypothetical protein